MVQALRWNVAIGLSDTLTYLFGSQVAESFEHVLIFFPTKIITALMIPRGTEATLMALSFTIMQINQFTIRNMLGLTINYLFVGVTNDNTAERYYILTVIRLFGSFIPLLFLWKMLPSNEEIKALQTKNTLK